MEIFLSIIVRVCVYEAYERSMCYTLAIDMHLQNLYLISSLRYIYIKKIHHLFADSSRVSGSVEVRMKYTWILSSFLVESNYYSNAASFTGK